MKLAIASQKGGVGKTTTAISLAAGLARRGQPVLFLDIDSQANGSKILVDKYSDITAQESICATIIERKALPIRPTTIPHLDIVPAHILLSNTDVKLTTAIDHREARLKRALDLVQDRYEHIIIDCPPALSWLTVNALTAAEQVLIPVAPGYFELGSIDQISKTLAEVQDLFNPDLRPAGFLFTMADSTINSQSSLKILRQTYTDSVLKAVIPRNTAIRDAYFDHQDIFSYAPDSKSAQAYGRLLIELFDR